MGFLTDFFGGATPPGVSKQRVNDTIVSLQDTGNQANNYMKSYGDLGLNGLNTGLQNLTPVANWFQTIMNGNRSAVLNQLQPQIQQIQGGMNTGLQTANNLTPRGGGRGSELFQLPFEAQKDIASQYAAARAGAPAGLQSAATAEGALGASAGGLSPEFGNLRLGANTNLLNYALKQGSDYNAQAGATGAGFAKLVASLPFFA